MLNSPNPRPTEEELVSLCGMWRWQFLVFALPIFYKEPPIQKSPTPPTQNKAFHMTYMRKQKSFYI